jgi:hypothetical protein
MAFDHLIRRLKAAPAIALALVMVIGVAAEAAAESAFCRDVRADYLRAGRSSGGGGGGDAGKIQRQLAAAQADAKRSGCRRVLFGKPGKNCPSIMARVNQLQRDLGRARSGGGGVVANNSRYERDRLRGILLRNGCDVPSSRDRGGEYAGSGYRTICVRTCDGYYFPISFSTNRSRFKIDEAVCQSMYGGAPAELYTHYNGSPSNTAVSLKGEPIMASTNAFAFRHFYSQSCQGQLHRGLANLGEAFLARIAEAQSNAPAKDRARTKAPDLLPSPVVRIASGQDPETLANLAGGFVVRPVRSPDAAAVIAASTPIRKLGPEYYYVTPIAIEGLRNPPQRGPVFSLIGPAHADEANDDVTGGTSVQ